MSKGTPARSGRARRVAMGVALGATTVGLAAGAAGASTAQAKTPLQQGLNFYNGKTITLISPDAPGGGFDTNARIIAPYMAQYLHATINVTNDSPANTLAGQDLMQASQPNGLTIGMLNPGTDVEDIVTGSPGVNFNPQKVQYLGGTSATAGGGFECLSSSQYHTFAQVVHSKTPVTEVIVSSGTQTLQLDLINAAFGINAKVIGGYSNTSSEVQGQERGDGVCGVLGINVPGWGSYLQAGKASLLMETKSPNPAVAYYSTTTHAMSLSKAYQEFPATTKTERAARAALTELTAVGVGHEFNAPARTPAAEVAALRAAVQYALTNVQCEDKLLQAGQSIGWVTGPRAFDSYKSLVSTLAPVTPLIKTALGI